MPRRPPISGRLWASAPPAQPVNLPAKPRIQKCSFGNDVRGHQAATRFEHPKRLGEEVDARGEVKSRFQCDNLGARFVFKWQVGGGRVNVLDPIRQPCVAHPARGDGDLFRGHIDACDLFDPELVGPQDVLITVAWTAVNNNIRRIEIGTARNQDAPGLCSPHPRWSDCFSSIRS